MFLKLSKRTLSGIVLLLLIVVLSAAAAAQSEADARIRFMHAVPGANAIDIYTNGELTITNLAFGDATQYVNVPAGNHMLTVTQTGSAAALWEQDVTIESGTAQTLIASSTDPLFFDVYEEDLNALEFGNARLVLVHAVADAPAVDVALANGTPIAQNITYRDLFGTFDLPVQTYNLAILPAGGTVEEALIQPQAFDLSANSLYMAVVYGSPAAPTVKLLATPLPAAEGDGFLRIAHTVVEAPAVDVYADDALLVPGLAFGEATEHIPVPAGDYSVSVRAAGTTDDILTADLSIEAGSAQTAVALGTVDDLLLEVFADDISAVTPENAVVSVINAIPESTNVIVGLDDGTLLADELEFGQAGDAVEVPATVGNATFTVTIDDVTGDIEVPTQIFYGGVYYNALALPGSAFSPPQLIFVPTGLMQGLVSAPANAGTTIAEASTDTAADDPVSDPVATAESPEVVTAPTVEGQVVVATPEATQPPAQAPATTTDGPTGTVLLNPGVNLQLRNYPSDDAQSLGLVPSGTVLEVNGREGESFYPEGVPVPEDEEEFVDPAEDLEEDEDLIPEETWLNVTYNTPDGGTITAWVNALYLDVRDAEGEPQRLADLDFVPRNQAGEAVNTAITPPPVLENRVTAVVVNLNAGVNLNIRRTPETTSEVLARIPAGTVTDFVGYHTDPEEDWVFIEYLPPEGGSITGWVSSLYVEIQLNGEETTPEELDEEDLLNFVEPDVIGEIGFGAPQLAQRTADPLADVIIADITLDPGANLHLRVSPDAASESLDLIPSGTRVIVDGRTGDGTWLNVNFEGQTGWIASAFTELSFNGETFELTNVPITDGTLDTATDEPEATEEPGTGE